MPPHQRAADDAALRDAPPAARVEGRRYELHGTVQGVGLRPRVLRLARACGLRGTVGNRGTAAVVEACGDLAALQDFEAGLRRLQGGGLRIDALRVDTVELPTPLPASFEIAASVAARPALGVAPDAVTCDACLAEVRDPASRRHRYPFTACTTCGPRLSVFQHPPYDRAHTTMAPFPLCAACAQEYADPGDRRFHAQATACPACGPRVSLRRLDGAPVDPALLSAIDPVDAAATLLARGEVLLVKGLGGYQLACDATDADAVRRLRALKRRDAKPLALMLRDLPMLHACCEADAVAEAALTGPAGPIVLLPRRRRGGIALAEGIAPGLSTLGVMLPPTALHHLLMDRRSAPIVLTSGNLSDEPQAITWDGARARLGTGVVHGLDHDRAIERRLDDSVGRVVAGAWRVVRRARGLAPAPLALPPGFDGSVEVLALGGDLKHCFALLRDGCAVLSQHIGELGDAACRADQQRALADHLRFYALEPELVACDLHPGYAATQLARARWPGRVVGVGHHHAHLAACLGEHGWPCDAGPVLGIALDGLGLGEDGGLWGGEFLRTDYHRCTRLGRFKPVALPGGDRAAREPWRNTCAQLVAALGWERLVHAHGGLALVRYLVARRSALLDAVLDHPGLAPRTSSVGRLFDAVAGALDLCREGTAYEGEAAMRLEDLAAADGTGHPNAEAHATGYPFAITHPDDAPGLAQVEPQPMWEALLADLALGTPAPRIAARFHRGLAAVVVRLARTLAAQQGLGTVALGGGVFQNRLLTEQVLHGLEAAGLRVLLPRRVPVNDAGLAWGQALVALARRAQAH